MIRIIILTKSTKTRLEKREATKKDLEIKIANEKIAKSKISPEFVVYYEVIASMKLQTSNELAVLCVNNCPNVM